jgi:hypothetical protein
MIKILEINKKCPISMNSFIKSFEELIKIRKKMSSKSTKMKSLISFVVEHRGKRKRGMN